MLSVSRLRLGSPQSFRQSASLEPLLLILGMNFVSVPSFLLVVLFVGASLKCPEMASKDEKVEQRTILKFLTKSGCTPKEAWTRMVPVFDDKTMCLKTVRIWHKRFQQGEDDPKDRPHPVRPRTARSATNIQRVQAALHTDRRTTLDDLSENLALSRSSVHTILKKDLHLSKLAPKFVPRLLTQEQKDFRKKLCEDNLKTMQEDPDFLARIVTGDESWISVFEVELKVKSKEWLPKGQYTQRPPKPSEIDQKGKP